MNIEIQDVSKVFGRGKQRVQALNGVTLEVEDQIFGLIGPNGAGKTTLIRMLCGLLRPSSGRLTIGGLDCWGDSFRIKRHVSFLHENAEYPAGVSAEDYLVFVGRIRGMTKTEAESQACELLEYLGLSENKDRWIIKFSKGMRQLVGIAASFMGSPNLIILDEPTANLDPNGRFLVLDLVRRQHDEENTGFLISSHILHELEKISTEVGFLFQGHIMARGRLSEIIKDLPSGNIIVRATKMEQLYELVKSQYAEGTVRLHDDELIILHSDTQEVSRTINRALQECGGVLIEFRHEEGDLERAFKELARRLSE
ncbi:MAG: ABC transporter ATP-binding protein [Candidatus Thorarchaeota archaeon]|nr:ABC transporter ATP-binding protein [Candidatus Thorarchaeota archaeon]